MECVERIFNPLHRQNQKQNAVAVMSVELAQTGAADRQSSHCASQTVFLLLWYTYNRGTD